MFNEITKLSYMSAARPFLGNLRGGEGGELESVGVAAVAPGGAARRHARASRPHVRAGCMSPLLLAGCLARDCMLHDGATSSAFRITLRFALWLLSNTALACCSLARQGNRQVARGLRLVPLTKGLATCLSVWPAGGFRHDDEWHTLVSQYTLWLRS